VSGIVFNLGALEHANVETLIVARSCLPLITSILDYLFLGRQVYGHWAITFFLNSFDFRSIHSVTQPPISCFPPHNISWKHSIRSLRQTVYGRGVSPDTQTRTQYRRLTSAHLQGIGGYWQVFCWCSTTVAAMIVGKHISDNMSLTLSSQALQRMEFPHSKAP
jgi:hypothetical protein